MNRTKQLDIIVISHGTDASGHRVDAYWLVIILEMFDQGVFAMNKKRIDAES